MRIIFIGDVENTFDAGFRCPDSSMAEVSSLDDFSLDNANPSRIAQLQLVKTSPIATRCSFGNGGNSSLR